MVVVIAKEVKVEEVVVVVKELAAVPIRLDDVSSTFSEKQERDFFCFYGGDVSSPIQGVL